MCIEKIIEIALKAQAAFQKLMIKAFHVKNLHTTRPEDCPLPKLAERHQTASACVAPTLHAGHFFQAKLQAGGQDYI